MNTTQSKHAMIRSNMQKAAASGFRLQYGRASPHLATCVKHDALFLGGLGALGTGIMVVGLTGHRIQKHTPDFPTIKKANAYVIREYGYGAINVEESSRRSSGKRKA